MSDSLYSFSAQAPSIFQSAKRRLANQRFLTIAVHAPRFRASIKPFVTPANFGIIAAELKRTRGFSNACATCTRTQEGKGTKTAEKKSATGKKEKQSRVSLPFYAMVARTAIKSYDATRNEDNAICTSRRELTKVERGFRFY